MASYYLFKKIKDGEISLDDEFEVSKKAWKKGGSKMFVNLKSMVRVEDLIRGIIVQSGNDACIVVAEGISGSEDIFADELNELANEIGLENSNFTNSTGWPDKKHLFFHFKAFVAFTDEFVPKFRQEPVTLIKTDPQ